MCTKYSQGRCTRELSRCTGLCAASFYDTKLVHFLTMCNEKIQWTKKEILVYNKEKGKTEKLEFLRLNINND